MATEKDEVQPIPVYRPTFLTDGGGVSREPDRIAGEYFLPEG